MRWVVVITILILGCLIASRLMAAAPTEDPAINLDVESTVGPSPAHLTHRAS